MATLSILVGALVIVAWLADLAPLESVLPGSVSMKANTAIGFILSGLALWLLSREWKEAIRRAVHRVAFLLALMVTLLGAATLDRMALPTAANFTLIGSSLLVMSFRRWPRLTQILALLAVLPSGLAFLSYVYGVPALRLAGISTPMALDTSIAFFLLAAGILAAHPGFGLMLLLTNDGAAGVLARRLLPAALALPLLLGWIGLRAQQAGLFGTEFGVALMTIVHISIFAALIWWVAAVTQAMDTGVADSGDRLRESEERFRVTFEQAPIGFAIVAIDGRWRYVNGKLCEIVGYAREELLTLGLQDITHPDDLETDVGLVARLLSDEIPTYTLEKRSIRKNGSIVFINLTVSLVRSETNEPKYFIAAIEDITERRRAEEAFERERSFSRAVIESLPGLFYVMDDRGRFLRWNRNVETTTGYSPQELSELTPLDFVGEQNQAGIAEWIQDVFETGAATTEAEIVSRDETCTPFFFTAKLVMLEGTRCLVGMGIDIRARKEAEAALKAIEWMITRRSVGADVQLIRRSGQPYGDLTLLNQERTILDSVGHELLEDIVSDYMHLLETSSAVYEKNGDYALGIFTSGWCQSMDLASYSLCGTTDNAEALRCGKWRCHESCWREASRLSMESDAPRDIECQGGIRLFAVPIHAGEEIIGSINFGYGDPPTDPARLKELSEQYGIPVEELQRHAAAYRPRPRFIIELAKERLLGSARLIGEIVQRKRAEDSLRQMNMTLERRVAERTVELEGAVQELEAFSYSVSHDLHAPLRAIDGFSRILAAGFSDALPPEAHASLARIRSNTQYMARLIDDLLSFSRLSRQPIRTSSVDPERLVSHCLELLGADSEGRDVQIVKGELPQCQADPVLLELVWMNLLSNAFKFTRRRDPARIEIGSRRNGGTVYFVRDNGVGFSMAYADKLFGVFQRLHRAEEYEGTGVGLATVLRVVQRHGGRLWAEAEVGRGATFYFTLEPEVHA